MHLMNRTEFTGLAEFHQEIKKQQAKMHGKHYTDNHDVLTRYGSECKVIKELGVAQGGTLATLLLTNPQKLTGVDFRGARFAPYQKYFNEYANKHDIDFEFIECCSTDPSRATVCDLLHIDSRHTESHLRQELQAHGPKVRKYIVFHDTEVVPALMAPIKEFMLTGWEVIESHPYNVGYTVIQRK